MRTEHSKTPAYIQLQLFHESSSPPFMLSWSSWQEIVTQIFLHCLVTLQSNFKASPWMYILTFRSTENICKYVPLHGCVQLSFHDTLAERGLINVCIFLFDFFKFVTVSQARLTTKKNIWDSQNLKDKYYFLCSPIKQTKEYLIPNQSPLNLPGRLYLVIHLIYLFMLYPP